MKKIITLAAGLSLLSSVGFSQQSPADVNLDGKVTETEEKEFQFLQKKLEQDHKLMPDGVTAHLDLAYVDDGHPRHTLDIYLPKGVKKGDALALVVWIHGGGWQKGGKEEIGRNAFLLENGFALASINYRLTSHAAFPAQIHDCKAAIRYLRKHAAEYGIDPDRIGVWGASAGGHLAALLGTSGGVAELEGTLGAAGVSSRVQAVCDFFGPANLETMPLMMNGDQESADSPIAKFLGGLASEKTDVARQASAVNYITKDDPPFLIMHGDQDPLVPLAQSEELKLRLWDGGMSSEMVVVEGAGHGFFPDRKDLDRVTAFFKTNLAKEAGDWIHLFNGKDLAGWTPKIRGHKAGDNYADTFRVRDGLLTVSYDQYKPEDLVNMDGKSKTTWDKFGHLFYNESFSHYLLRVEYRFVGEQIENGPEWAIRNNGIMIHGQTPETMEIDQKFPSSLEVQLLGGNGTDYRPNLNLCTPGTHVVMGGKLITPHVINSSSSTYHGDEWVTALIEVRGNEVIRHWIDGRAVIEYGKPQYDPKSPENRDLIKNGELMIDSGTISIQSESAPIEFRRIDLKKLDLAPRPALGNWALVMPDEAAGWLSLSELGEAPKGELWTVGSPKDLAKVKLDGNQVSFTQKRAVGNPEFVGGPPTGKKIDCFHRAIVSGDRMEGVIEIKKSDGVNEELVFRGKRMPPVGPRPDLGKVKFGEPVELFNGKNLDGWRLSNPQQENMWKAVGGVLVNETPKKSFDPYARYGNLRSDREFMDFKLHIEFKIPAGGNSGVYLRGAYEVQVVDRDSRMQGIHGVGAIFGRILPSENAGKVGDEWQSYDITLVDRHVTVVLNGTTVIDNEPLPGATNGGTQADETGAGPIFLQGDHTSVSYRNITVSPVVMAP